MLGPTDGEARQANGRIDLTIKPTYDTYEPLQYAYEHFNWALFDHRLPNCLITLQRKTRCFGYFAAGRMARQDGTVCDEIALNPVHFREQGDLQTLSILVHEMVHLWQRHFGIPGRGRYHNKQWSREMKRIGLHPSHTGLPGGRETGDQMWHYIVPDGAFDRAAKDLIAGGFMIAWTEDASLSRPARHPSKGLGEPPRDDARETRERPAPSAPGWSGNPEQFDPLADLLAPDEGAETPGKPPSKSGVRVKYSCPECGLNAWSRHGALIKCGLHNVLMLPAD